MPCLRFIIAMLLRGKRPEFISNKLKQFRYSATPDEIQRVFMDLKSIASKNLLETLESGESISLSDEAHAGYAKEMGVYEYIEFIEFKQSLSKETLNEKDLDGKKPYYKWFEDILWIHRYPDILVLVNTFIFNEESMDEISAIISFKYKKKISVDALNLHKRIFWDITHCSAKEVILRCIPFREDSTVIKTLVTGEQDVTLYKQEHKHNGMDINVVFHPSDYIKWKIGYKKITPPSPRDFVEAVKTDSYFKYYESLNMSDCVEYSHTDMSGGEFGAGESTAYHYKNIEEQRAKLAKHWFDMYIKAHKALPPERESDESFFDKLDQYSLSFEDEKITRAEDVKGLMDDVREDLH